MMKMRTRRGKMKKKRRRMTNDEIVNCKETEHFENGELQAY